MPELTRYRRAMRPQMLRRWATERCEDCGQRRRLIESWTSFGNRDRKVWHGPCMAAKRWRSTSDERLSVLTLICDVWQVSQRDVESLVALRTADDESGIGQRNLTWRVMHAVTQAQTTSKEAQ